MRVAHIITRMILGGAQENTLLTCEDLRQIYGDEVLLITGPALGPEGSLLERARARGVPLVVVPSLRRTIHPLRDFLSLREIQRILRDFRPDVVHTHSAKGGLLGRAAASALGVRAIVHGVHGAPFHPYQNGVSRAFFRACERWAARRCHAFISVADAMTDLMVEAGVARRERFTTIYSGMEVEPFCQSQRHRRRVRQDLGYNDEHVVVGKIARLFRLKGHDDVIDAARTVVADHPQTRFLFVGDGAWRERLRRRIRAAGLAEHVQFTGLVAAEKVPELVAAMDIVVHASLREGLARVLPQALIAGKPVVSFDIDGAREVVLPDVTGYLVEPRDVAAMAKAIGLLASDAALRLRLGAEGRRRFTEPFRHEQMTAAVRVVYERLLAEGPNSAASFSLPNSAATLKVQRQGTDGMNSVLRN